jgi:hypothetical protein
LIRLRWPNTGKRHGSGKPRDTRRSQPGVGQRVNELLAQAKQSSDRAFRHVVRNVYTFNLNPNRITELAADLPACYEAVQQDLMRFRQFLLNLSE